MFPLNLHWTWLQFSDFCCENWNLDGTDVQAGLTGRTVYRRHVNGFLIFLVRGVWFNLQRPSFQNFMAFLYAYWADSLVAKAEQSSAMLPVSDRGITLNRSLKRRKLNVPHIFRSRE
jgi:hypothetical protein